MQTAAANPHLDRVIRKFPPEFDESQKREIRSRRQCQTRHRENLQLQDSSHASGNSETNPIACVLEIGSADACFLGTPGTLEKTEEKFIHIRCLNEKANIAHEEYTSNAMKVRALIFCSTKYPIQ
ncbi:protein of unknown function [Hyphomicrobium sp. MC1]|nr:protein of unknown function [Hyphomicrobium sp. MC1]